MPLPIRRNASDEQNGVAGSANQRLLSSITPRDGIVKPQLYACNRKDGVRRVWTTHGSKRVVNENGAAARIMIRSCGPQRSGYPEDVGALLFLFTGVCGYQGQREHRALDGGQHVVGNRADGQTIFERGYQHGANQCAQSVGLFCAAD